MATQAVTLSALRDLAAATPLSGVPTPAAAGTTQSYALPRTAQRYLAIRAIDEQGNIGLPAVRTR